LKPFGKRDDKTTYLWYAFYMASVISYLTGRPSPALLAAAHQQVTRDWWDYHRHRFEQFISPLVIDEASRGDPDAAARRLSALDGFAVLDPTESAAELVDILISEGALPDERDR
jgi:hypothetical protein